ncbi:hypothetical protein Peur_010750 [Populus x canadensis]
MVTSLLASKTVQLNSARLQFALLVGITTVILTVVNVYCVSMQSGDLSNCPDTRSPMKPRELKSIIKQPVIFLLLFSSRFLIPLNLTCNFPVLSQEESRWICFTKLDDKGVGRPNHTI